MVSTDGVTSAPIEFAGVARTVPALFNDEEVLGRLDWQPSTKDRFFVRYYYQNDLTTGDLANAQLPLQPADTFKYPLELIRLAPTGRIPFRLPGSISCDTAIRRR